MAQCIKCGKWLDAQRDTLCEDCVLTKVKEFHELKLPKETLEKIGKKIRDRWVRARIKKYSLTGDFELVARARAQTLREVEKRSVFAFVTAVGRVLPVRSNYRIYDVKEFQDRCPFCQNPSVVIMLDYQTYVAREYRCLHCGYEWEERIK